MPKWRRRARLYVMSGRPPTSTSAFGRSFVSGRRRVPRPAAKTIAFTSASGRRRGGRVGRPLRGEFRRERPRQLHGGEEAAARGDHVRQKRKRRPLAFLERNIMKASDD